MNLPNKQTPELWEVKDTRILEKEKLEISNSVKSILQFYPETLTLVLDIENVSISEALKSAALWYNLLQKEDYHITIIWTKVAKKIIRYTQRLHDSSRKIFMDILHKLMKKYEFQVSLGDEVYYIEKSYDNWHRFSIIQLALVDNLKEFYADLSILLWEQIELPFPHITLFTNSTNPEKKFRGIGIYSQKEFEDMNPIQCNE